MSDAELEACVAAVRRFSRFYTRRIGLLHEGLLGGPLSLPEGRIVYEIAQREKSSARDLGAELDLDSGYLSRLLRGLEEKGLIARRPSAEDARQNFIDLTALGREAFSTIDGRSREEIGAMLEKLSPSERRRLTMALGEAEQLLGSAGDEREAAPYVLRPPRPGDMGWIVHRQGALYAREYAWDETFEALVAEIVAAFIRNFDSRRERCWIAERNGAIVGSVFLVRGGEGVAKLRLLYVEAEARGLGIGRKLVDECIHFARDCGYARLMLWTNDVLASARRIYQAAGFRLVGEEPHHSFGHDLIGQTWDLAL
jgi:DNA-binding MarR family transcriptional regulator/GNAT superfamily N-acetyltransferase